MILVWQMDRLRFRPDLIFGVYGYAALVGYTLSAGKLDALTAADNSNPLFLIAVSAILGAVLGYLMGQLAGVLKTKMARAAS
jgi:membrane protein YqaA with SNARE-associated domain